MSVRVGDVRRGGYRVILNVSTCECSLRFSASSAPRSVACVVYSESNISLGLIHRSGSPEQKKHRDVFLNSRFAISRSNRSGRITFPRVPRRRRRVAIRIIRELQQKAKGHTSSPRGRAPPLFHDGSKSLESANFAARKHAVRDIHYGTPLIWYCSEREFSESHIGFRGSC